MSGLHQVDNPMDRAMGMLSDSADSYKSMMPDIEQPGAKKSVGGALGNVLGGMRAGGAIGSMMGYGLGASTGVGALVGLGAYLLS